jgi:hypothetical protein
MAIREINPSQGIIIAALDYRDAREVPRPQELMDIPVLIDIGNFYLRSLVNASTSPAETHEKEFEEE